MILPEITAGATSILGDAPAGRDTICWYRGGPSGPPRRASTPASTNTQQRLCGQVVGPRVARRRGRRSVVAEERKRPGNTPVEQQERSPHDVESTRRSELAISGPGAADFLTAGGGLDRPESGSKGMAQTRDEGPLSDPRRLAPRPGPDTEEFPGERHPEEQMTRGASSGRADDRQPDRHHRRRRVRGAQPVTRAGDGKR
jgi:hypothetical protein